MSFPVPSKTFHYTLKRGYQGHDVAALQLNLSELGEELVVDGDYGIATEKGVRDYQRSEKLDDDGIAGPVTQRVMCRRARAQPAQAFGLPGGMAKSLIESESGYYVGAVNWISPGGVDCGWTQDRVYSFEFTSERLAAAFSGAVSIAKMAQHLRTTKDTFYGRLKDDRKAWQYAGLNHNWQAGAEQLSMGTFDHWRYVALFDRFDETYPHDDGVFVAAESSRYEKRRYNVDDRAQWVLRASGGRRYSGRQHAQHYIDTATLYVTSYPH